MQYVLLISEPKGQRQARTPEEGRDAYAQMQRFALELQARGVLKACESLLSEDQGVRVQVRAGRQKTLDGPFSETKEMIGGFLLVECATLGEAATIAAQCPAAGWATVEVRPVGPCFA